MSLLIVPLVVLGAVLAVSVGVNIYFFKWVWTLLQNLKPPSLCMQHTTTEHTHRIRKASSFYYTKTNEILAELLCKNMIFSHMKIITWFLLHMWKDLLCYGHCIIISRTFCSKKKKKNTSKRNGISFVFMQCIMNRTWHGYLEIWNFSL